MKKGFRKAVIILMAVTTSLSFASCIKKLNESNASEVSGLLNEKYQSDFVVHAIGDRLASDGANVLTAYCSPKDKPEVVFTVKMNTERELMYDDYPVSLLCAQARDRMNEQLAEKGFAASSTASVLRLPEDAAVLNADLFQVIDGNRGLLLTFDVFVCDCREADELYEGVRFALREFYQADETMSLGVTVWNFGEEQYEQCCRELAVAPGISETVLNKLGPIGKVTVSLTGGEASVDQRAFASAILAKS